MNIEMLSEHEGGSGKSEESASSSDSDSSSPPSSPPRVDDSPLQKCMDRNKQSLKVKLMMRRPYLQLVDQGIMPPSFHEQRQKLQRAKMGDLLKHKIQHRPDRTELIRQHILEADTGKVDPSLAERQRMLKRARLADSLNDQLSHRPGPLELIQKNILHTDENVERAVKGSAIRPSHPIRYVTPEGDDSSSEGALSPSQDGSLDGCLGNGSMACAGGSTAAGISSSPATIASSPGSQSSVASPAPSLMVAPSPPPPPPMPTPKKVEPPPPPPPPLPVVPSSNNPLPVVVKTALDISKNRNRKKSKQKCPPKPRTIKFHEYKGPPNAQKLQPAILSDVESSYELLLQQQQLFLQWQLEWQHKYPQIILPAKAVPCSSPSVHTTGTNEDASNHLNGALLPSSNCSSTPSPAASTQNESMASVMPATPSCATRTTVRLEEMKVSDLKAELKKRNLPVSGSKPQLIDRLRPFVGEDATLTASRSLSRRGSQSQLQQHPQSAPQMLAADDVGPMPSPPASNASRRVSCSSLDGSISSFRAGSSDMVLPSLSPTSSAASCSMSPSPCSVRPPSVVNNMDTDIEMNDASNTLDGTEIKLEAPPTPPPIAVEQQIDELVRGLQEEQRLLMEQQHLLRQQAAASAPEDAQQTANAASDPKSQQKVILQQYLHLKIQQQKIQLQLEQLQHIQQQGPPSYSAASGRTTSSRMAARANRNAAKLQTSRNNAPTPSTGETLDYAAASPCENSADPSHPRRSPPPNYTEASRMLQQPSGSSTSAGKPRVSIKSQLVDDVLDILIRNGELPPSAAHDPVTPTTPRVDPPPMPPPLPSHLLTKHPQALSHPAVSATEIKFPYIDINELGLNLDLDSLGEAMELGVYENHSTGPAATPSSSSSSAVDGRNDEVTAMEMDVSDWLDTLLPPLNGGSPPLPLSSNSSVASSSGFSSLGSDQHNNYLLPQPASIHNYSHNSNQLNQLNQQTHQQMSGDPLFSSLSSDPYTDLFALEDTDMKLPGLGNTLSWDRLDFTA
uniref:EOG090X04KW n=1 Tax=Daphnia hispanica TaxID=575233 RepID=A0A4Y7M2A2_9CRUS|nr:EOG090X04KW [Daphnia hispanica]